MVSDNGVGRDREQIVMSIRTITSRLAQQHRANKQERDLARAIMNAPTQATRQELLALVGR